MRVRTITSLAVAGLLLTSHAVLAQPGPRGMRGDGPRGPRGDGPGSRIERMAEILDLGDAQVEAITKIREEARAQHVELRKQLLQLRHELDGEMLKDDPDQATLDRVVQEMGELKTRLQRDRLATQLAVREELTEEQADRWLLMREKGSRQGRGHGGRGPGGGRHGCGGHGPRCHD